MKHGMLAAATFLVSAALFAADKPPKSARAELKDAQGKSVGTATLKQRGHSVRVSLSVHDLPPGVHAFHIHTVGKCEAPDFKSAGAHFNPGHTQHGLKNPAGPHAGDLPNVIANAKGKGKASVENTWITLDSGDNSVFHEGGTAIVIHEKADDERTDPAGNAGSRIACGVITK